jgi:hypothetical protein
LKPSRTVTRTIRKEDKKELLGSFLKGKSSQSEKLEDGEQPFEEASFGEVEAT